MSKINTHESDLQMNETWRTGILGAKIRPYAQTQTRGLTGGGRLPWPLCRVWTPLTPSPTIVNHLDDLIVNDIFKREVSLFVPFMYFLLQQCGWHLCFVDENRFTFVWIIQTWRENNASFWNRACLGEVEIIQDVRRLKKKSNLWSLSWDTWGVISSILKSLVLPTTIWGLKISMYPWTHGLEYCFALNCVLSFIQPIKMKYHRENESENESETKFNHIKKKTMNNEKLCAFKMKMKM